MKSQPSYITINEFEETLASLRSELEEKIEEIFNHELAVAFGQMAAHFDKKLATTVAELREHTNEISRMADAAEQRIERLDSEHVALSAQVDRQQVWQTRITDAAIRSA